MKQLILGIDGGDLEILQSFHMPFLKKIIESSTNISLTEDLRSRGWAEIITGEKGHTNNSFYIKPKGNGKAQATLSYTYTEMKSNSQNPLIWELIEKMGGKAGVMNVPTTYPAAQINGFFVSGAGGGLYEVEGIPDEMCDSLDTKKILEELGYILELRFAPSGIEDPEIFFERLNEMMKKRFQAFSKLCSTKKINFGFLALRASANMQYVVMREIKAYMDGEQENDLWNDLLETHYSLLDSLIENLFQTIEPKEFIITSDHGQVPLLYHANYNILLSELGYLNYDIGPIDYLKYAIKRFRNFLGASLFRQKYGSPSLGHINYNNTKAFGFWYSNGLYINDEIRFNGIVKEKDIEFLAKEISKKINNNQICKEHSISASPLRSKFKGSSFYDNVPDIWIDAPDTYFFRNNGTRFIDSNAWYKPIKKRDFKGIHTSMFTGIKGRHPLCIVSPNLTKYIKESDDKDLTLIYKITNRYLEGIK